MTFHWRGRIVCDLSGLLIEAGNEVWQINRNVDQVGAMNRRGLLLRDGGVDRAVPVHAATTSAPVGVADLVLVVVLVKSFHTREAMEAATSLLGPGTAVLSLENGPGHEDILAGIVGRERVLAGKTYARGSQLAPGHVLVGTRGKDTHIGELDGTVSARFQRIDDTFNAAGLETLVRDNILGTMWDKLLINVATGALSHFVIHNYGKNSPQEKILRKTMGWTGTEFEPIDLGDERRNKRAILLVERLSAQPTASVPQACGDWADTKAA